MKRSNKSILLLNPVTPEFEDKNYISVEDFTFGTLRSFTTQFIKLNNNPAIKCIPIIINSYGGQVYALQGMLDVIDTANKPVLTIAAGAAMSCGSVLLSAGTKGYRYASPRTRVMIHQVSSMERGKSEDIKGGAEETEFLNTALMQALSLNAGKKDLNFFANQIKKKQNVDWFLSAKECKQLGLIDHVGFPELLLSLKGDKDAK